MTDQVQEVADHASKLNLLLGLHQCEEGVLHGQLGFDCDELFQLEQQ